MTKTNIPLTQAFRLAYPKIVCLITAKDNIITLAWTTTISFNPPIFGVSIGPTRYTHKLITEAGAFGVNLPTMEIVDKVLYCGRNSGRMVNKFEKTGLTPIAAKKIDAKLIKECVANFECEVIDAQEYGDHTLFVGKVVAAMCEEGKYLSTEKRLKIEELELIYHCGGDLFCSNQHAIVSPKK
ncbi:MAG: flavin reductase family protein [Candidatus Helarchaeota archaeon]|nr:flavin reductase family protein [Candidatus Helarchaeota archaeon]